MDSYSRSFLLSILSPRVVFASSAVAAAHTSSTSWLFSAPPCACGRAQKRVSLVLAGWLTGWFGKYLVTINDEWVYLGSISPPAVGRSEVKHAMTLVPKDVQYLHKNAPFSRQPSLTGELVKVRTNKQLKNINEFNKNPNVCNRINLYINTHECCMNGNREIVYLWCLICAAALNRSSTVTDKYIRVLLTKYFQFRSWNRGGGISTYFASPLCIVGPDRSVPLRALTGAQTQRETKRHHESFKWLVRWGIKIDPVALRGKPWSGSPSRGESRPKHDTVWIKSFWELVRCSRDAPMIISSHLQPVVSFLSLEHPIQVFCAKNPSTSLASGWMCATLSSGTYIYKKAEMFSFSGLLL